MSNNQHMFSISNQLVLKPLRMLGSGSFGYVYEAYDETNKKHVAVKRTTKVGEFLSRELTMLNKLKGHPNIVTVLGFFYTKSD